MKTVEKPWNVVFYMSIFTAWPLILMGLNTDAQSAGRWLLFLASIPVCLSVFALANYDRKGWS